MWRYYPDLLADSVPRYTSFPTAAEFRGDVGSSDFTAALSRARGDVSLYVHIPFCDKICWYCGCNTAAANHYERLANYLDALHREIVLVGELLPQEAKVARVAFGGGSPNAIAPTDFVRLIDALTLHFGLENPLISVEFDPRGLTDAWGDVIVGVGVARASLGVQTFASHLQSAIGRVQPGAMIESSVALLRRAGVQSLNFDLMYGLPGQTRCDLAQTLAKTVALGADRIALFGYAHVPERIPRQRKIAAIDLPDAPARFRMAADGHEQLSNAGYAPVGFDHFALPGDPLAQAALEQRLRRNFQGFTDDPSGIMIGLGASAISTFPACIVQAEKNTGRYRMMLSQNRLAIASGVRRSREDRQRAHVIESLLCHGRARMEFGLLADVLGALGPFIERGLVGLERGELVLTAEGLPYTRSIAAQFDPYRKTSVGLFSSAV